MCVYITNESVKIIKIIVSIFLFYETSKNKKIKRAIEQKTFFFLFLLLLRHTIASKSA